MGKNFNLKQIKSWGTDNTKVELPSLQRGLVWSPKQVELLWDSILRNFPIGGFVLSENNNGNYYLMDGQQRFNAIQQAFLEPDKNSECILWIDLDPATNNNTTRVFFIKATTRIHPWGFNNDDVSSVLRTQEKRNALEEFGMKEKNIFKDSISLLDTYPVKANCPVPFSYLLLAPLDSDTVFSNYIIEKLEQLPEKWKEKVSWTSEQSLIKVKTSLGRYYQIIKKLDQYTVPYSLLPATAFENETQTLGLQQTNLEVLFTRLNTGGTPISRGDLQYSAIKAYWGDDFKSEIDRLAQDRMQPQTLAILLIRLALSLKVQKSDANQFESKRHEVKFENNLSIRQIRDLAKNQETKKYIEEFIFSRGDTIVDNIDSYLTGLPPYIIMKIISERQDIYLLLMLFACESIDMQDSKIVSLILLFYWFSTNITECVNRIFKKEQELELYSSEEVFNCLKQEVSELHQKEKVLKLYKEEKIYQEGKIRSIFSPNELKEFIKPECLEKPNNETPIALFWEYISNFRRNDTMLIFAEKDFLNEHYPNYIPAKIKDWDKTNRSWDYDHIVPQIWSAYHSKSEPYKEIADYWLWRTGNFAAIPFEINRSKNGYPEYSFYEQKSEQLLFSKDFEKVTSAFIRNDEQAKIFAKASFERTIRIYEKCFDFIKDWII